MMRKTTNDRNQYVNQYVMMRRGPLNVKEAEETKYQQMHLLAFPLLLLLLRLHSPPHHHHHPRLLEQFVADEVIR